MSPPIQLAASQEDENTHKSPLSCCAPGFFSKYFTCSRSSSTTRDQPYPFYNDISDSNKFIYSAMAHPEESLPCYQDVVDSLRKLDLMCTKDVQDIIHKQIDSIQEELRAISLDLHEHVETGMKEVHAHQVLTDYLEKKGFKVTRHAYGMKTAFMAEYSHGQKSDGRRIGVCSEYDGLPGLGQGCGHNLIAISGVATVMGIKAALESGNVSGKVVLFGTPAEELSVGKIELCRKKAFQDNVDVCVMLHPTSSDQQYAAFIAVHDVRVEFFGKASHAAAAPWEGVNALDALIQVWNGISMMRQQLLPTDRVHGIVTDGGQAPNIIPEHTSAFFFIRTTRADQINRLVQKMEAIFEAAALATGCQVKYTWREIGVTKDVIQNRPMADVYAEHMRRFGIEFPSEEEQIRMGGGSTDMGNVSYEMPVIHPTYGIHTTAANHTVEFTKAAKTMEAHHDTLRAAKGLAATGVEVLLNDALYQRIKEDYERSIKKVQKA
ncbi:hypothetical protein BDF20DRAFT_875284 [Mycotypha africana]|uniref:uncharacterized protein n=1 Tax=Mycotypha africana TaxID=64632 RepID=UPI0023019DB0|nr:uncharacterized protein BDF20DRAFT_875284 [Mycotypha africana]KAI8977509.1 hypothetical protein BDF20DRAFT_875284 [Mycotypha africana]